MRFIEVKYENSYAQTYKKASEIADRIPDYMFGGITAHPRIDDNGNFVQDIHVHYRTSEDMLTGNGIDLDIVKWLDKSIE